MLPCFKGTKSCNCFRFSFFKIIFISENFTCLFVLFDWYSKRINVSVTETVTIKQKILGSALSNPYRQFHVTDRNKCNQAVNIDCVINKIILLSGILKSSVKCSDMWKYIFVYRSSGSPVPSAPTYRPRKGPRLQFCPDHMTLVLLWGFPVCCSINLISNSSNQNYRLYKMVHR